MSYDFIVAVVMFLAVYTIMLETSIYPLAGTERTTDIYTSESRLVTEILTKTPGYPPNWTTLSEVDQLGLTRYHKGNNPQILDVNKLEVLNDSYCSELNSKLPVNTSIKIKINARNKTYECM